MNDQTNTIKPQRRGCFASGRSIDPDIDGLRKHGTIAIHGFDDILFDEGEQPNCIHVLLDGVVQLYAIGSGGDFTTIDLVEPVRPLAIASVYSGQPYAVSARALNGVEVLSLDRRTMFALAERDAALGRTMMNWLADELAHREDQLKSIKLENALVRLCRYLLGLLDRSDGNEPQSLQFDKKVIAGYLGMNPSTLSRNLSRLRKHGVDLTDGRVSLLDRARLERLAREFEDDRIARCIPCFPSKPLGGLPRNQAT